MKIIDLRSEDNRERETRALEPLEEKDEEIAQQLARFVSKAIKHRKDYSDALLQAYPEIKSLEERTLKFQLHPYPQACQEIRKIGETLCDNGGTDRMDLICYRIQHLCGSSVEVRENWAGICGWVD